ncbi:MULTISPECIES: hypothetical protein [Bacillus cereus group]|uniref:hypothetical protein n=1 Tax=Bacillus cereus group TaxID=86661 RepID=UPI001155E86C|nr:hypothetical protein [Bacillus thuringiensis]MED3053014.1 hypothetical protein [Bacillus thuringiensis]
MVDGKVTLYVCPTIKVTSCHPLFEANSSDVEKKEIGKYLISQEVSTLNMTSRESIVKKASEIYQKDQIGYGESLLLKNYYPHRFTNLKLKFRDENLGKDSINENAFKYNTSVYLF